MKRSLASSSTKMWIDGKCFEINIRSLFKGGKIENNASASSSSENVEERQKIKYEMSKSEDGQFVTSFHLPSLYYQKLLDYPPFDLKTLESGTNTTIHVPQRGNLVITGNNEFEISKARDEIHSAIGNIRNQQRAMQFISIPTLSEEIVTNFNKFKHEILNGERIYGVEESIFQNPLKLHLTIAVFCLLDEYEMSEAVKALQDYKSSILDPLINKTGPLTINVAGVGCMEKNLRKVNVLYASARIVDETDEVKLQKIVNDISDHFYERGLMKDHQDNVTLHMTLMNTKYRNKNSSKKGRWPKRQSFDATSIMEKYKEYSFGKCCFNSVRLSLMSSVGEDGFYTTPFSINLNSNQN